MQRVRQHIFTSELRNLCNNGHLFTFNSLWLTRRDASNAKAPGVPPGPPPDLSDDEEMEENG